MKQPYFIMGLHPIEELMKHAPERIKRVYTTKQSNSPRKQTLFTKLMQKKIPLHFKSIEALSSMVESDSHQSMIAEILPNLPWDLKTFLPRLEKKEKALLVMLDSIFDPQNFGAILRSCECFGADGVIWSKNRGADLSPSVAKASSGASEFLPLIRVSNLAETASHLQGEGFSVLCAEASKQAKSLYEFSFPEKTLLILGSEGEGIQPLLKKRADQLLFIPMEGKIGSFNVSQATSIFLSHWHREMKTT